MARLVFGPVPSRRLGQSLGINNIPPKHCTYSCIYCQIGRTTHLEINRREFYPVERIISQVEETINRLSVKIDFITVVPDGEPTLDVNLGHLAEEIKNITTIPLAVISNSSLLWREDVREDLLLFDLVSLKIDAIDQGIWKLVNRPHPKLVLERILDGIFVFSHDYKGKIITETMLVKNINDSRENIIGIASFLSNLRIDKAYIAVPTRPPAEKWVKPADEDKVLFAHEIFSERIGRDKVELLTHYEGALFHGVGDPIDSFLSIISVHPMRIDYAYKFLEKFGLDPEETLKGLLKEKKIVVKDYKGIKFVLRRIGREYS